MLFNVVGGLQTLPAGCENISENWHYIKPLPGHVIINLGDAIVQWTGGLLRANMHRVTTPPGEQAKCTRFSVGYLVRPAADASMKRLKSSVIPLLMEGEEEETRCAREWGASKAKNVVSKKILPKEVETQMMVNTATEIAV
jgi:isopenicillin N synthase-like dioxygenase